MKIGDKLNPEDRTFGFVPQGETFYLKSEDGSIGTTVFMKTSTLCVKRHVCDSIYGSDGSIYKTDVYNTVRIEDGKILCTDEKQEVVLAYLKMVKDD